MKNGSITNAMIGNVIQSNNFVQNQQGWRLDKNGIFENYGSTPGEGATKFTNEGLKVKDANGVLRVEVGRITGSW